MPARFGMVLHLWNHADDDSLLEQVCGEVGLDHVTVPVVTGPLAQFRARNATAPCFRTEGGWHYPVAAKSYAGCGARPARAHWTGQTNHLARLADRLATLGAQLVMRLDPLDVTELAAQEAHLAGRNAWGQATTAGGACPSSPDLRELLRLTIEELRLAHSPAAFEIACWDPDRVSAAPWLPWAPRAGILLDTCFCAACRQVAERAGVDVDAAGEHVRRTLRTIAETAAAELHDDGTPEGQAFAAYRQVRRADCHAWLARVAGNLGDVPVYLAESPDAAERASVPTPLRVALRIRHPEHLQAALDRQKRNRAGVSLPGWKPLFGDSAGLVRFVTELIGGGAPHVDFEGLDTAPRDAVTWVRQAVRYARRGS